MRALLIATLLLLACAPAAPPSAPPPAVSVFHADSGAIFAGEDARKLVHQCSRQSPGPVEAVWTPTQADIDALEPALGPLIEDQLSADGVLPEDHFGPARNYYRQYGGLVVGGRRIIYVNGFNAAMGPASSSVDGPPYPWRTEAVGICDGGQITFGVEYDPATRVFSHFAFNGDVGASAAGIHRIRACNAAARAPFEARHLDGAASVLPVGRDDVLATYEASAPVLPLSTAKLFLYAIYLKHQTALAGLAVDSHELIGRGVDDAGRRLALELRHRLGSRVMLNDLRQLGVPACSARRPLDCTKLTAQTPDAEWANALSIGEANFTVTAFGLSRFMQAMAEDRLLPHAATLQFEAALRDTVETGTAASIRGALGPLGAIGGKTGTGPASANPRDGVFAGLVFDPQGAPRFAFATYVRAGGAGGTNAAAISVELARAGFNNCRARGATAG